MRGKKPPGLSRTLSLFLVLCFSILLSITAQAAQEVSCVLVAEDVGNGYRYEAPGIGGFTINGREGETLSVGVISLDEGCVAELLKDGYEADFNDGVILENGSYELRIYREGAEDVCGVFRFTVENSYGDMLDYSIENLTQVNNPDMEMTYDPQTGRFTYTLPDGEYICAEVPFGGWSGHQTQVEVSENMNVYRVLKDGEPQDFSGGLVFSLPGSYRITLWDNELGLNGDTSYRVDFCFVLYAPAPKNITHINAPMGFQVRSLLWEGNSVEVKDRSYAQLERDGTYEILFENPEGTVRWQMELERDTTAPALYFSQDVEKGQTSEYVSFTPSEGNADIEILWNGQQVEAYSPRLAMDGRYQLTITDQAGNSRQYEFTLRKGFEIRSGYLIVIPVLLLAAAGGTIFYWRRNMRVL